MTNPATAASPSPAQNTVRLKFVQSPHRAVHPVSGAFGGVNGQGQLIVHLYAEYAELPSEGIVTFDSQGKVQAQRMVTNGQFTREVLATLNLELDVAASLGEWLNDQVKKAREIKAK